MTAWIPYSPRPRTCTCGKDCQVGLPGARTRGIGQGTGHIEFPASPSAAGIQPHAWRACRRQRHRHPIEQCLDRRLAYDMAPVVGTAANRRELSGPAQRPASGIRDIVGSTVFGQVEREENS